MRALAAAMALFLVTSSALAANPKVENALKVLQDISRDPAKMKTFCEMMVINKKMGDKEDPVLEAQIDKLADQLGPAFKAAWDAIDDIEVEIRTAIPEATIVYIEPDEVHAPPGISASGRRLRSSAGGAPRGAGAVPVAAGLLRPGADPARGKPTLAR